MIFGSSKVVDSKFFVPHSSSTINPDLTSPKLGSIIPPRLGAVPMTRDGPDRPPENSPALWDMKLRAEDFSRQGEWSVRQEILTFLRRNPGIVDTAKGIALRIYRDPELTELELGNLCEDGYVLVLGSPGRTELYSLREALVLPERLKKAG